MLDLRRHVNVLQAMIIRDLMGRFGRQNLGFVWTVLEQMILCTGVMVVWSFIHAGTMKGVPIVAFVLTGYMPLTLWRHLTNPMSRILHNNVSLLYHRPVSHAHILAARLLLEFFSTSAALLVIYFVVTATGMIEPAEDPGLVLAAWLLGGWYFAAMGLVIGAWTEYWEPAEKFLMPAQYLQLPVSGIFYMVDWMPHYAQQLLMLNPTISFVEMFRAGMFGEAVTTYYDPAYLAACSAAMTIAGVVVTYRVRDHIETN